MTENIRKYCKVLADLWRFSDNWGWVTSNLLITRSQRRLTTRLTSTVAGLLPVWMTFAFQLVSASKRRWEVRIWDVCTYLWIWDEWSLRRTHSIRFVAALEVCTCSLGILLYTEDCSTSSTTIWKFLDIDCPQSANPVQLAKSRECRSFVKSRM